MQKERVRRANVVLLLAIEACYLAHKANACFWFEGHASSLLWEVEEVKGEAAVVISAGVTGRKARKEVYRERAAQARNEK